MNKEWTMINRISLNEAYDNFINEVKRTIDRYALIKHKIILVQWIKQELWVTKGLLMSARKRLKLYKKCKLKPRTHPSYTAYINYKNPFQFGLRKNHSTIQAITTSSNDILQSFEKKESTVAVFCDPSKAFDTLNHDILLKTFIHRLFGDII